MTIRYKVSKNGVFSGPYIPVFSPNTGKYGPEKTPYLDIFRAVPLPHHCFIPVTTTPHALPENLRKPKVLRGYRDGTFA